tara:strand:+ start:131 stop:538 length:408 start_codon:yes stop_codon:yes gene_type:complete
MNIVENIEKQLAELGEEDTIDIRLTRIEKQFEMLLEKLSNITTRAFVCSTIRDISIILIDEIQNIKKTNQLRIELTRQLIEAKEIEKNAEIQKNNEIEEMVDKIKNQLINTELIHCKPRLWEHNSRTQIEWNVNC